ncbi:hypothetical protein [Leifsonia sp. TF02-11]|uniref:hypothetical protein n=1 Tax=Leifsonia sp. TF02-11 TaxID=2815212 RepID=UPI001AA0DE8B|nr:hypothetical protein [Leifsonia sp. TF02-11]MBO1739690.1 hypothetical protein [Leifsonia sp. TF02-11]
MDNSHRVKVACINWGHDGAPKAMSYVLWDDGDLVAERYHNTWEAAMDRANGLAISLHRMVVA